MEGNLLSASRLLKIWRILFRRNYRQKRLFVLQITQAAWATSRRRSVTASTDRFSASRCRDRLRLAHPRAAAPLFMCSVVRGACCS
jgi:hypothetical protein